MIQNNAYYWDIDFYQIQKHSEHIPGDVFACSRPSPDHYVAVLSDGLGSGVKAHVLARLTSEMASGFVSGGIAIQKAVGTIMDTLPVCSVRKISYSTFTIADIRHDAEVRVIEYDNPHYVYIRNGKVLPIEKEHIHVHAKARPDAEILISHMKAEVGDRIILFSDGVTQSGMGTKDLPLGWEYTRVVPFLEEYVNQHQDISSKKLARELCKRAYVNDQYKAHDDITCGVLYLRNARTLLVVTGPPFTEARDGHLGSIVRGFSGNIIVAGGTTAKIVARELGTSITVDLKDINPDIPPSSHMEGVDLVTEGFLTLSRVVEIIERGQSIDEMEPNAATRFVEMLLSSDIIHFVVGTKVNEAHQDPTMPVEIELRRTVVKRIMSALQDRYLKQVTVEYL